MLFNINKNKTLKTIHKQKHTQTQKHINIRTHTNTKTQTNINTHTQTNTQIHRQTPECMHTSPYHLLLINRQD